MLILVAVTISMAVNGGLFEYAGKAAGEMQNAIDAEQQLANGGIQIGGVYYNSIDEYLKGFGVTTGGNTQGIKVGDYVNYTPTTGTYTVASGTNGSGYTSDQTFTTETGDSALQWRILSIDEETGEIELVSATAGQILYLQGADGYNHAVDILNDLCESLYSNENGATARSMNVEDINAKTTFDYEAYINPTTRIQIWRYVSIKHRWNRVYEVPNLYSQEIGYGTANIFNTTGLSESEGLDDGVIDANGITTYSTVTGSTDGNTAGTDPYITYTYYSYTADDYLNTNLGINTAPSELFYVGTNYWLATRGMLDYDGVAEYYVRAYLRN